MNITLSTKSYSPKLSHRASAWSWLCGSIAANGGTVSLDNAIGIMMSAHAIGIHIDRGPRGYVLRRLSRGHLKAVA